jgi:hypothetical protein
VNKRQRQKQLKKAMQRMTDFFRDALKHKIGDPLTPTALHEISNIIGDTIKAKLAQPSFASQIFLVTPVLREPYRQWQMLGREQLTHAVGMNTRTGGNFWKRFCDYEDVDAQFILSSETMVDCLRCIAREGEVRVNAVD